MKLNYEQLKRALVNILEKISIGYLFEFGFIFIIEGTSFFFVEI